MGNLSLLQWIFLTQESNLGLLHCRQILYQLKILCLYKGSPYVCVCVPVCVYVGMCACVGMCVRIHIYYACVCLCVSVCVQGNLITGLLWL